MRNQNGFTRLNNEKGAALVFTLFLVLVLVAFSAVFVLRAVNERNNVERELRLTQSLYIADGSSQSGLKGLDTLINNYMLDYFREANPSTVISEVSEIVASVDPDGIGFLLSTVRDENDDPVLTDNDTYATYVDSGSLGGGTYSYTITITEKGDPSTVTVNSWDFPFNYEISSTGISSSSAKNVLLSGDFTVRVQRDNFAKYALFTNEQETPSGSKVWFTSNTNFDGPIHTNDRYNVYGNPSGVFEGIVEQVQQTTRYYNNGNNILLDDDHNGTRDVPTFNDEFNRDVDSITLGSPSEEQDLIDQALADDTASSNGIYVPNSSGALSGGIYVEGDSSITMSVDESNNAVYAITQGGTSQTITVDRTNNQTVVTQGGSSTTYSGLPNGVDGVGTIIYVNGDITSLSGTVQGDTQLTISSEDDIVISDHIRYANYNAAVGTPGTVGYIPPNVDGHKNLLGLVSWTGDVRIGTSAPDDVDIHGTLLAKEGIFTVDSYTDQGVGPRGTATLMGGVITDNYGAFGQFNGSTGTQLSGYGRNFVYDSRMETGSAPPYFPSLNTFIAFTNDITDKLIWQEGDHGG